MSSTNKLRASPLDTKPAASGRWAVRLTEPSILRSAKSLITHPALRITKTPKLNTTKFNKLGVPSSASHSAQ